MIPEGWLENLEDLLVEALSVPALIPEPFPKVKNLGMFLIQGPL